VLVERLELADECSGVLEDDPHPAVDVTLHLVALTHLDKLADSPATGEIN